MGNLQTKPGKVSLVDPKELDGATKDATVAASACDRGLELLNDTTSIELMVEGKQVTTDIHTVTRSQQGYLEYVVLRQGNRDGTVNYFVVDRTDSEPHWVPRQIVMTARQADELVVDTFTTSKG